MGNFFTEKKPDWVPPINGQTQQNGAQPTNAAGQSAERQAPPASNVDVENNVNQAADFFTKPAEQYEERSGTADREAKKAAEEQANQIDETDSPSAQRGEDPNQGYYDRSFWQETAGMAIDFLDLAMARSITFLEDRNPPLQYIANQNDKQTMRIAAAKVAQKRNFKMTAEQYLLLICAMVYLLPLSAALFKYITSTRHKHAAKKERQKAEQAAGPQKPYTTSNSTISDVDDIEVVVEPAYNICAWDGRQFKPGTGFPSNAQSPTYDMFCCRSCWTSYTNKTSPKKGPKV